MKTLQTTSLIAIGALLPLAAWGDDTRTQYSLQREAYDPRPSETRSGPPATRAEETRERIGESERTEMRDSTASPAPVAATAGTGIERVSEEQVERRVTASELIGAKVIDREGREIGKVKDVGLGAAAPQLASQAEPQAPEQTRRAAATRSTDPDSGLSQPWTQTDEKEARVFVRPARALGAGDSLVAIPAAQLHREGDALRVDISREELRAIVADQESGRVSMNR